jgi:RimJ/RimL family protein N-acetyltransferase
MEDKEDFFRFYESLSDEALLWGMPPYTREALERNWLSRIENMISLIALHGDLVVGHAQISKFPHARRRGCGDFVMYVHQDFHNVGLGTAMMDRILELARKEGMHRIGLHVVADNSRAVYLYEKFGFRVEGVLKASYFGADGKYHDELAMGLILA